MKKTVIFLCILIGGILQAQKVNAQGLGLPAKTWGLGLWQFTEIHRYPPKRD